ncbi:hypothetical protein BDD43_1668 [Mucilaginibacter gracilis]|uniref:Uncharacterized protein n=1 Tax=Mucilaginibacter gracilis TaxID=423350 RepID=A0A495IYR7_9SPHI|nr:hypothetical protein BDD43_1668 [Mucilaginibacter gracilis]
MIVYKYEGIPLIRKPDSPKRGCCFYFNAPANIKKGLLPIAKQIKKIKLQLNICYDRLQKPTPGDVIF